MIELLRKSNLILMEAAVNERLRRSDQISTHPRLSNALLVHDLIGKQKLANIFNLYINVAQSAGLPILLTAPTWRANRERLTEAGVVDDVNGDNIQFLRELTKENKSHRSRVYVGGLMGCKNDCYRPDEGISTKDAHDFHHWQASKLVSAGADYLMAATLPALPEAIGIAKAMSEFNTPYIISFVINRNSRILDGSELSAAFDSIDNAVSNPPLGFMINCAYPSFLDWRKLPQTTLDRLIGYQGNASSLDHSQLDGAAVLHADELSDWGDHMLKMNEKAGIKILGGCCGTDETYLEYLINHRSSMYGSMA